MAMGIRYVIERKISRKDKRKTENNWYTAQDLGETSLKQRVI